MQELPSKTTVAGYLIGLMRKHRVFIGAESNEALIPYVVKTIGSQSLDRVGRVQARVYFRGELILRG